MFTGLARPNCTFVATIIGGVIFGVSISRCVDPDSPDRLRQWRSYLVTALGGEEDRLTTHTSSQLLIDLHLTKSLPEQIDPGGYRRHGLT